MPTTVQLSMLEVWQASIIGVARQIQAIRDMSAPKAGAGDEDDWTKHIEGACGELAFAKHLGVYWTGAERRNASDVGRFQVRTRSRHDYDLIVRPSDPDKSIVVLVTGRNGFYVVHGCIEASRAKQRQDWIKTYGGREPAWFVPQDALEAVTHA